MNLDKTLFDVNESQKEKTPKTNSALSYCLIGKPLLLSPYKDSTVALVTWLRYSSQAESLI